VRAIQTRRTMTTPRPRVTIHSIRMMTTPVTTPVRQRPYQMTQLLTSARFVSWHRVIHASRWCRAVINASASRVATKCTTKDAAVLFAARLSTCCCVDFGVNLCLKITLRGAVTKYRILNILSITLLDHECHI